MADQIIEPITQCAILMRIQSLLYLIRYNIAKPRQFKSDFRRFFWKRGRSHLNSVKFITVS